MTTRSALAVLLAAVLVGCASSIPPRPCPTCTPEVLTEIVSVPVYRPIEPPADLVYPDLMEWPEWPGAVDPEQLKSYATMMAHAARVREAQLGAALRAALAWIHSLGDLKGPAGDPSPKPAEEVP